MALQFKGSSLTDSTGEEPLNMTSTCPTCGANVDTPLCGQCGMTVLRIIEDYRGGRGFVTTEQVKPTEGTLRAPIGFWVPGQPTPKTGTREPKALPGWQSKVQQAARMQRLGKGQMGAFQPASVILQFATDDPDRIDLLCRSTLDALTHSGLLHDDSAVIDLVATRRPVDQSSAGEAGVHVVITPGELLDGSVLGVIRAALDTVPHQRRLVASQPRVLADGAKKDAGDRSAEWMGAVKQSFAGHKLPKQASLVCEFMLPRWLEPDGVQYPIVNGRDIDKISKSTSVALGVDVIDVVASKRLGHGEGYVTVAEAPLLTRSVLDAIMGAYPGVHGHWSR